MNRALTVVLLAMLAVAGAQENAPSAVWGNYAVQQSSEFGWRFSDTGGNPFVYNTLVNLHAGPRLLEQTLSLRSLNHHGLLFDDFWLAGFGFGGDPENHIRLRAGKNRWYNFAASFRRDRKFWDYSLFANPLNPAPKLPQFTVSNSPHRFEIVRRMTDYNLTLFPQSRVRLRESRSAEFRQARGRPDRPRGALRSSA